MREVKLTVTTRQSDPERKQTSLLEETYTAVYSSLGGRHEFRYTETEPESGAVTQTVLRAADTGIEIERRGNIRALIRLVPGEDTCCSYETPYGTIPMTFRTGKIRMMEGHSGEGTAWTARAFYSILQGDNETVLCALTLHAEFI